MNKLLYIQASPRLERSHSIAVADAFVRAYQDAHPGDQVSKINLFHKEMEPFDGLRLEAKYAILHGKKPSEEQMAAWKHVEEVIAEFKDHDKYVWAVPMWNFMIPYRLKHYLDILAQPTYTFEALPDGSYQGLVGDKPVFIAFARGGSYPAGTPGEDIDFQSKYLKFILGFMGLKRIEEVFVDPSLGDAAEFKKNKEAALARAREVAAGF